MNAEESSAPTDASPAVIDTPAETAVQVIADQTESHIDLSPATPKSGDEDHVVSDIHNMSIEAQDGDEGESTITNVDDALAYEKEHSLLADTITAEQPETVSVEDVSLSPAIETGAMDGANDHSSNEQTQPASEEDDDAALLQPEQSVAEQNQVLESYSPEASSKPTLGEQDASQTGSNLSLDDANDPSLGYSHQGEVNEMDEALDEAPNAPLMMDPAATPTVEETGSLAQSTEQAPAADTAPHHPHIDRSFTTNFTELPTLVEDTSIVQVEASQRIDDGWPAVGDDKTFGELLDSAEPTLKISHDAHPERPQTANDDWGSFGHDEASGELSNIQQLGKQQGAAALDNPSPEDLTAMWQAALDDDELLSDANEMDPSSLFGDDDEGLLDDDVFSASVPDQPILTAYPPTDASRPTQALSGQSHARSAATPETGLFDLYGRPLPPQQSTQRPDARSAGSFADKSKGGYQSPYDLPMDVVKQPRQRPRAAPTLQAQSAAIPPPRPGSQAVPTAYGSAPAPVPTNSVPNLPPLASARSATPPVTNSAAAAKSTQSSDSGFFADLPVANKPRSRLPVNYVPAPQLQPSPTLPPSGLIPGQHLQRGPMAAPVQPPPRQVTCPPPSRSASDVYAGLRKPEQLPLLPDDSSPTLASQTPSVPVPNQRYSPISHSAPTQSQNRFSPAPVAQTAPSTTRYSPALTTQQGQPRRHASGSNGIQQAHPFAPRTSSPLAFAHERPQPQQQPSDGPRGVQYNPASPAKTNGARSIVSTSPERPATRNYSPSEHQSTLTHDLATSPQRTSARSPSNVMKTPKYSVQSTPPSTVSPVKPVTLTHRRQFSRDLVFAAPSDERANDPLERWKGHPIFHWGPAGGIVQSLPKQTPFYASGQTLPSVRCTPGIVVTQEAPSFLPMDDRNAAFPGPLALRAKGKKKDVVTWMTRKVEDLERLAESARADFQMHPELKKRADEKLILWKIVKIYVEQDGSLDTNKKIEEELRTILLPNLSQMGQVMQLESPASSTAAIHGDPIERAVIIQLRQALLEGQRERAVWLAEEKKLWGHAMLIASTMGPETWKQVVQSFVRSQVKTVGSDARALAALYQVFAGNAEECVDELVPPSARAGFKMVSKVDRTSSSDPLEGLDQWRETLGLVVGNRTNNDAPSLLALGQMLSGYGRAEAAHSCFLFARQLLKHSGPDDAEAHFVLLGANHKIPTESCGADLDSILLTEVYEWASSLTASSSTAQYIPHLQSFKLVHAQQLAAYGLKTKAQSYCDHITSAYTSTTRPSPYYHPTFTQSVNDLSAFLSQTPHSGPQSLLSKTAMNKVSSGAASWFTKFVSGDDDQSSTGSGPGASSEDMVNGPFGKVNGDSPGLSRTGSSAELYNPMMGGAVPFAATSITSNPMQQFQPSSAPSRYAPAGKYAPVTANSLGISTTDAQRPSSSRSYAPTSGTQALDIPRRGSSQAVAANYNISRPGSAMDVSSQGSYEPKPLLADEVQAAYGGYQPYSPEPSTTSAAVDEAQDPFGQPPVSAMYNAGPPDAEYTGYEPPSAEGYEPPTGVYEPPSYQPYEPDPETNDTATPPKPQKKSFMDDDDDDADFVKRAAAMKKQMADRAADDAFKKAAEADAARDKEKAGNRKSWFGGLFKKDPNAQPQGPIRAKLGEENSFYFDKELKKWVNKNAGSEAATPVAATPPPPRGPVSRVASGVSGPPSGPPSRVSSIGGLSGVNSSPGRAAAGSPAIGPSSGPPSRVGTPSTGLDVGPPLHAAVTALNGEGPPSSGPPARPSSSMSNASSLDDLLGGPPGPGRRMGGGAKAKKKAGRYVDVMANS